MRYSLLTASNSNNLNYYNRYVLSINLQNPLPSELIFVDDGIKQKNIFFFIRHKLKKKIKLIYIKNSYNKGITKSLNIGLNKCNYYLIFRLDIDDTWKPNHAKTMLNEFKLNKKFLIYANKSKHFNSGINDKNLILDNPTIHSSWVINLHTIKKKNFRYLNKRPEDYATLSHYYRKGLDYKCIQKKTVNHYNIINSFSKNYFANKDIKNIKKENLKNYLKKNSYIKLFFDLGILRTIKLIKFFII